MARYLNLRTAADVERRLEAGRGKGHGSKYLPWFYVHEVPSRGRSHKVNGLLTGGRLHYLLSDCAGTGLVVGSSRSDIRGRDRLLVSLPLLRATTLTAVNAGLQQSVESESFQSVSWRHGP